LRNSTELPAPCYKLLIVEYERGSTIVTSNQPFDEWTGIFASERLTGALLDRFTHHVHIFEMNGPATGSNTASATPAPTTGRATTQRLTPKCKKAPARGPSCVCH
jgi:hypothetical protein